MCLIWSRHGRNEVAVIDVKALSAVAIISFAMSHCSPKSGSEAEDNGSDTAEHGSTTGDSDTNSGTNTSTDSGTGSHEPPEDCETRQQRADGSLAGPSDVQAVCDSEGSVTALSRPEPVACTTENPAIEPCSDPGGECQTDADCVSLLGGGQCGSFDGIGGACACVLPCESDGECPSDRACLCRTAVFAQDRARSIVPVNGCWPATCRSNSDCGPDGQCALTNSLGICVLTPTAACRSSADPCQSDTDCEEGWACEGGPGGWACANGDCQ